MSTPEQAKKWMKENRPAEMNNILRSSKYYPGKDILVVDQMTSPHGVAGQPIS